MDAEAQAGAGSRERGCGLGERAASGLHGERAVRRAEGRERDAQLGGKNIDVGGGAKEFVHERAPLFIAARVVWPEKRQEVALGLKGEHLDEVRQVLALGGELDDGAVAHVTAFDSLRERATSRGQPGFGDLGYSITRSARSTIDCGSLIPRAFAVRAFTTSSTLRGNSTGRSSGLAPRRMRLT